MKGCKDCENYEKQIKNLQLKVKRKYYRGMPKEVRNEIDALKLNLKIAQDLAAKYATMIAYLKTFVPSIK